MRWRRSARGPAADLDDPRPGKRAAAVARLAALDDPESEARLFDALRDASQEVRLLSAHALVKKDPDRAARPIVEALRGSPPGTPYEEPDLREMLEMGVYDLRELRPRERFTEALRDPDPGLRAMAANVLGAIGEPEAAEALTAALEDPVAPVRDAARDALARLPDGRRG